MGNSASSYDLDKETSSLSGGGSKEPSLVQKYKKTLVFLGSVVFVLVIVLLLVFVFLKNPPENAIFTAFTMNSVFNSSLSPSSFRLQWGGNGEFFIYQGGTFENVSSASDWQRFDLASKASSLYVNATGIKQVVGNYSNYVMSNDGKLLLFSVNESAVWRHSFVASYLIYSVEQQTATSLVDGNPLLQNVLWNPSDNQVAYVRDNDIYVYNPVGNTQTRVTSDGNAAGGILNGIQSWVYEEEVFATSNAMWWSDDGTFLAFLKFNESQVPIFEYTMYTENAYPDQIPLRYPLAGFPNPVVQLLVYNVKDGSMYTFAEYGAGNDWEYVASVQWAPGNVLWVQQLNRYQNVSTTEVLWPQEGGWTKDLPLTQTSNKWIEIHPFVFCTAANSLQYALTLLPNNGYYHIANIQKLPSGDWSQTFLTNGNFDIISIAGCSVDSRVFYLSTEEGTQGATVAHIYATHVQTPSDRVRIGQRKEDDGYFSINFSPLGDYFLMGYLGPAVPQYYLVSTDATYNLTLENNDKYAAAISEYELPEKVFTTVKGANGDDLNVYYKKPKNVKSGSALILDVYGGPGSQDVRQVHDVAGFDAWLCAQGYVVASVDGRGTGRRGLEFLQATYRQLGVIESVDQRAAAKNLAESLKFVDESRVAIWGWSYGGFMSLNGIAGTSPYEGFQYKVAVSVAPVTSWTLYDTIYTERFMSTPQDNPEGYNATSLLWKTAQVPQSTLLLMHGLADDNVHFQNSAEFVLGLIQDGVHFDTMYYPNSNHAINNGKSRQYLYQKMTDFLNRHL